MTICHIQSIFSKEHGGPTQSLSNYCRAQVASGHAVSLRVLAGFPHTTYPPRILGVDQVVCKVGWPPKLGGSGDLKRHLRSENPFDIYHLHGVWHLSMAYGARQALRYERPYVVELMGAYSEFELARKRVRKAIARAWYQDELLHQASCLHVNSEKEGQYLRDLGFRAPIAVIPVGVNMADFDAGRGNRPSQWPSDQRKTLLYLSRVHWKKGIDLLINSWKILHREFPDWQLVIAGTGEPSFVAECESRAREGISEDRYKFVGQLTDNERAWALKRADVFVLPTRQENFGNVIAEALAAGTPVVTTTETPWRKWLHGKCGWVATPTLDGIVEAVRMAICSGDHTRAVMGSYGKELVKADLSIESVVHKIEQMYEWLLGGRKPDDIWIK
jgi:glycosyltransferase involved in cell wall biosynthesis